MAIYNTASEQETEALGERLAQTLAGGELLGFGGGLGAGKTAFCRGMARGLGSTDAVQSPTFTIANVYNGRIPFAHFDAYRIQTEDDLEAAGFYEYLSNGAVVAVEWYENILPFAGPAPIRVLFSITGPQQRQIEIEGAQGF